MRVHVATIHHGTRSDVTIERFHTLAESDIVGRHTLVEDPDEADVVLVVDLHSAEEDAFPPPLRPANVPRAWRGKVRVWDQRDNGYYTHPGLYVAPAARLVENRRQKAAPYISTIAPVAVIQGDPDLLFSFVGTLTYPTRAEILRLSHERAIVEEARGINFFTNDKRGAAGRNAAHERYLELIARSKFVLCPRGLGPSTFRLYETMAAGRVPVIISDQWLPPERIPWASCSIPIPERSVNELPTILEAHEERWVELHDGVEHVASSFLARPVLWNYLMDRLAEVRPGLPGRPWWADRRIIRQGVAGRVPRRHVCPKNPLASAAASSSSREVTNHAGGDTYGKGVRGHVPSHDRPRAYDRIVTNPNAASHDSPGAKPYIRSDSHR